MPKILQSKFQFIESQLIKLVTHAIKLNASVYIITNAEFGWVELSAEKFMPKFSQYLSRITVISARTIYQYTYPNDQVQWKIRRLMKQIDSTVYKKFTIKYYIIR